MVRRQYPPDPNGAHARLYHNQLKKPAWIALSSSAIRLYVDLRLKLTSFNNGNIEAVFSELRHRGWKSKTTLHKALRELEALGFIEKTRMGGIASMSRICNLFRFTDIDCHEFAKQGVKACKATHDYRRLTSIREARATFNESERRRKSGRHANKKKEKVQKPDFISPVPAPMIAAD